MLLEAPASYVTVVACAGQQRHIRRYERQAKNFGVYSVFGAMSAMDGEIYRWNLQDMSKGCV